MNEDLDRKKKLEQELERVVETLREKYKPRKILLFGSLLRGHTHAWSDIDLVVVKNTEKRFVERLKEVALLTQPKVGIDFFVYTPEEFQEMISEPGTFQQREMFEKGKVIYDEG